MSRPIGYYVHHHGDGHRQRAMALARASGGRITLLGTGLADRCPGMDVIDLPDDRLAEDFDGLDRQPRPAALHYAPIDHDGVRRRTAAITAWIAETRPAMMVVDVSVEVAMLARLAATRTVYVRLSGRRFDRPHLDAYRGATALLAPFHPLLEDDRTPQAVRRMTHYAPGILASPAPAMVVPDTVLGVVGRGGGAADGERWVEAARATPALRWTVIGPCTPPRKRPANLDLRGWVDDPAALIAGAGIVVGAAGDGLVGTIIAAGRPLVCLPESRPFDEQRSKADRLAALGAAIVCPTWPAGAEWPALLDRAKALDPAALAALHVDGGAETTARWLCDLAENAA